MMLIRTYGRAAMAIAVMILSTWLGADCQLVRAEEAGAPRDLRCEYQVDPLGIDTPHPRLSWRLDDSRRGARQTAYQVLVASESRLLDEGHGDLWDSGKVASDESAHVVYAGKRLESRRRCYWKVRTWDAGGAVSPWSAPACWEMALLAPGDWKARWIEPAEMEILNRPIPLTTWYWLPSAAGGVKTVFFRAEVNYQGGPPPHHAIVAVCAGGRYEFYVNGQRVGSGGGLKEASWHTLFGPTNFHAGRNVIAVKVTADKGPSGLTMGVRQTFYGGRVIELQPVGWRCAERAPEGWMNPDFDASGWAAAKAAGKVGDSPWGEPRQTFDGPRRSQIVRKDFRLPAEVRRARAYVTGLGFYELHLNGRRVGKDVFTPGWTLYDKRIQYQVYDVTKLLQRGGNAVGAILGNGWWSSGLGWAGGQERHAKPGENLRFLLQLEVECVDGTRRRIVTDASWTSHPSPILEDTLYHGETYDARLEQPGWDRFSGPARGGAGFRPAGWKPVKALDAPVDRLNASKAPPLRVTGELKPARITSPAAGVYVLDFAQNHSGRPRLRVRAPAGARITIRHAEILGPDGMIDNINYRSARATDVYICKGGGEEIWSPRFTYRGYRYEQVTGLPEPPTPETIVSEVLHTAAAPAGKFECSNPLINRILKNVVWGQRSNIFSVPTDCPQRDERLGWMGDAAAFAPTSIWNMHMARFYSKWMRDIVDSQHENGAPTGVSPRIVVDGAGRAAWADAVTIIPWQVYRYYGDTRILEENYEGMKKWVDYIHANLEEGLYEKPTWGDWVPVVPTPAEPISACYGFYSTKLFSQMAAALGKDEDAARYSRLAQEQARAFNAKHFHPDTNQYITGTQTSNLLPLAFGMVEPAARRAVADNIARDVIARGGHHSTGFLGTTVILPILAQYGRADLAWRIVSSDEYPSLGYMVRHGATTIWERWNTDQMGPEMNSRNHFAFGSMAQWFFEGLAGVQPDAVRPGFKHIVIRPYPVGDLRRVRLEYPTPYGRLVSGWERQGGRLELLCVIPANTTATIQLPGSAASRVREGGRPLAESEGVTLLGVEGGRVILRVGAGRYRFSVEDEPESERGR